MLTLNLFAYTDTTNLHYNKCNRKSDEFPFVINCAGITATDNEYRTINPSGRVDWYMLYVASGTLYVKDGSSDIKCTDGNFIIFPPERRYEYYHENGDRIECFWIHFSGSDVEKAMQQYGFEFINKIKHDMIINSRYQNIFNTFASKDKFRNREFSILLDRLLLSLAKRTNGTRSTKGIFSKSINHINENYNSDICIPTLAELENCSLSRYNVLFRQATGMAPRDYIKQLRLSTACELLLSTDMPINLVGSTVGYPNQGFFSRIFKRNIGVTPTEYRRNK